MKVFVTGGTGFTGSFLTRRLLQSGHQVVVLDNQKGIFHDELKSMGAQIHLGSVADRELVERLVKGCEVIQHIAAMFRRVNLPKKIYWDVNVEGTRYLLDAGLKYGVQKFINCSTCGVHGHVKNEPADENSSIAPADYYQYTKYEGEKLIRNYIGKGMKILTLRPTAIYGPGDPERFLMLFKRVQKGTFPMLGRGTSHYHPAYIDNLIDAFILAQDSTRGDGETYLIGDENYYTLNDLVHSIAQVLDVQLRIKHLPFWPVWTLALACELVYKPFKVDPPIFRRRVDWFRQNRAFNIERAKKELGYQPKIDLLEGLKRTANWYKEKGYI